MIQLLNGLIKYKKKPLREQVLEGKVKELEEKNRKLVESLGKKIVHSPSNYENESQPIGFTPTRLQDIQKEAYNIVKSNPKFLDYLQTLKFALKNELMREAILGTEKRYILLGQYQALDELINNIKQEANT